MPAADCPERWANKLLPWCEKAFNFIVARYKTGVDATREQLWDEYLRECFPKFQYAPLASEKNQKARLRDIKGLVKWSEESRTLQAQVTRYGVSHLVPKQIFFALA